MVITSVNNPLIKETTKLHKKKYRDQENLFLMEGYHLYEEALQYGKIKHIFTTDQTIKGDKVIYVNDTVLEKLSQTKNPQGVLVVCEKLTSKKPSEKVLILQNIQDPGNVGTLLRSALGFGFDTVVLDQTADLYNDKVLRSAQGNIFRLNIIFEDTLSFMKNHKEYFYYGTAMNGKDLDAIGGERIAIILGNEGSGVSKEVLSKTHQNISIKTNVESLNVGVAGSIIMHHINRTKKWWSVSHLVSRLSTCNLNLSMIEY